jgi:hypothetical protein
LRPARGIVLFAAVAACQNWSALQDNAVACLTGSCEHDAGDAGASQCRSLATNPSCILGHGIPSGQLVWKQTFASGDAGTSRVALASTGCRIDVLTAFDATGQLRLLDMDGVLACVADTFEVQTGAVIDLAARGNTIAAVWSAEGSGLFKRYDQNGAAATPIVLMFPPSLVQVDDHDAFVVGLVPNEIHSQRINLSSATWVAGPTFACDPAQLGSLSADDAGSFLLAGSNSGNACYVNAPISQAVGFLGLANTSDAGTGIGSATDIRAAYGAGGLFYASNDADPTTGKVQRSDLVGAFPGHPYQITTWVIASGTYALVRGLVVDATQNFAWLVLAVDGPVTTDAPAPVVSVQGPGGLVLRISHTLGGETIDWVLPIGGSNEEPIDAVLVGDQLLVAGICRGNRSELCPDAHSAWVVSISP